MLQVSRTDCEIEVSPEKDVSCVASNGVVTKYDAHAETASTTFRIKIIPGLTYYCWSALEIYRERLHQLYNPVQLKVSVNTNLNCMSKC
jgi:hypothetical protein